MPRLRHHIEKTRIRQAKKVIEDSKGQPLVIRRRIRRGVSPVVREYVSALKAIEKRTTKGRRGFPISPKVRKTIEKIERAGGKSRMRRRRSSTHKRSRSPSPHKPATSLVHVKRIKGG